MKRVLCYGDSNTHGYDPVTRRRMTADQRWTGVLATALGPDYLVIEEGLNGRTTRWEDPLEPGRNGLTYLAPCLESHTPLDLVMIMLGTNDLKQRFRLSAGDIAQSAASLAKVARMVAKNDAGNAPRVLLIAPPATTKLTDFDDMFAGAGEKSALFPRYFARAAQSAGVDFFDAGSVIQCSDLDGIHFEVDSHRVLGQALAEQVRQLLAAAQGS